MATLNANALVQLDRVKVELDIPLANPDFDDQIIQYINQVSDVIELDTNRIFREQTYTHRFTGKDDQYLILEQSPVTVLTEVRVDNKWVFGADSDVAVGTEVAIDKEVFLVRRGKCNRWPAGEPMNVRVQYTAGYSTIPDGLQGIATEYVRLLYLSQGDRRIGRSSKNKQGESASFDAQIPPIISSMLAPYRRENVVQRALSLNGVGVGDGQDSNNK